MTDAAKLLVQHAEKILSLVEEAEAELESRRDAVSGEVAIGAFPTASRGLAPGALVSLAAAHPQLQVELREMEPTTQLALVAAGLGACVVPRLGRGAVPDIVRMVRVEPGLSRHIYAVWRADAARRSALRVIVAALRKAAERCAS